MSRYLPRVPSGGMLTSAKIPLLSIGILMLFMKNLNADCAWRDDTNNTKEKMINFILISL